MGRAQYTPHYERHLQHLRGESFTLLELGIGGYKKRRRSGASMKMWRWFFPKATIVGLDIEDKTWLTRGHIHTYLGDQTDPEILHRIVEEQGAPLVVIDDGSHIPAHVRESFRILFPLLPDGAIYCIEDTQTSYWPAWGGELEFWDRTGRQRVKSIAPIFNRVVIFDTSNYSYHGHPQPLLCPPDRSRKSIALYYYTVEKPEGELDPHTTLFLEKSHTHVQPADT